MSGSHLRIDPIFDRWVLIAPERSHRPSDIQTRITSEEPSIECPFCRGNEHDTPTAVYESYRDDRRSWDVRVVPNRFPAVRMPDTGPPASALLPGMTPPIGTPMFGQHEVIIECPEHVRNLAMLPVRQLREVLRAYRARCLKLREDSRLKSVTIFKNVGAMAGASLAHSHSQLIALPIVPPRLQDEVTALDAAAKRLGQPPLVVMIEQERQSGDRWIAETERMVCFAPHASRFAFEAWIMPKQPSAHFENLDDESLDECSILLHDLMRCLEFRLGAPAFNYVLHTAPWHTRGTESFHWHIELIPRLHQAAGFEWGTDLIINPTAPEQAAAIYRQESSQPT